MEYEPQISSAEANRETLIEMLGSLEAFSKVLPLVVREAVEEEND